MNGLQVFLNEDSLLFPRGVNYEIEQIHRQNLKIIISRTRGQISTKLSINHPWLKGSTLFQMEIITKLQKYIDEFKKSSLPEPLGQFQPNLAKAFLGKEDLSLFK